MKIPICPQDSGLKVFGLGFIDADGQAWEPCWGAALRLLERSHSHSIFAHDQGWEGCSEDLREWHVHLLVH